MRKNLRMLERGLPLALAALVVGVYLPSLGGGFLNWDDGWLVGGNTVIARGDLPSLAAIWTDISASTRLVLGAEYLPIRDSVLWLVARLGVAQPLPLRLLNLAVYLGGVFLLRGALRRTLTHAWAAEAAAWLFALHPAHVESVAWISGLKDVLALAFVAGALFAHAGQSQARRWAVPLLLTAAYFAKSMTVISAALLFAQDWLGRRRLDLRIYVPVLALALGALVIHMQVGRAVGMMGEPVGGSRWTALLTMGPVWLRYLELLVWPGALSLVHDVPIHTRLTAISAAGYLVIIGWAAAALAAWVRARSAAPAAAWVWFVAPLLPVSQFLFPLQNLMADRYLLFSVLALGLLLAPVIERQPMWGLSAAFAFLIGFSILTFQRAALFADSAAVFGDALLKTKTSPIAPYQFAQALEAKHDDAGALAAYHEVLRRAPGAVEESRRATNNLAKLYARHGRLADAERVLERGIAVWPNDRRMLENLRLVYVRQGRTQAARAMEKRLQRP
jgi:protein O-mannosyl-transferase